MLPCVNLWYNQSMATPTGTDEQLQAACLLLVDVFDARPVTSYPTAERCAGFVQVSNTKGWLNGRHRCGNVADSSGCLCQGPCVPVWIEVKP